MPVTLMGKTYDLNSSRFLNVSVEVSSKRQLIRAARGLISQGMSYDPELSWDISSNEYCFVFKGMMPNIILSYPKKQGIDPEVNRKKEKQFRGRIEPLFEPAN